MPGLKRTYHITPQEGRTMAKRLRLVERRSRLNKSEMKSKTFGTTGTLGTGGLTNVLATEIAEGAGPNDRIGKKIRIWRIEVRGDIGNKMDNYIIQQHTNTQPTATLFGSRQGAFLLDSTANTVLTVWKHYRPTGVSTAIENGRNTSNFKMIQKFRGMEASYSTDAATGGVRNLVAFTMLNRSADSQDFDISVRVWFTDA